VDVGAGSYAAAMIETYDRRGDRILIGNDDLLQAFDARTSGTIGVFNWSEQTGWTKDDRDFTDINEWKAHVDEILAGA